MLDPHILLASASPRRSELLTQIGVRFAQLPVDIDESQNPGESPVDYVSRMAVEKAQSGWARQTGLLPALGADTTVVCGEQIFGKPVDQQDALNMLSRLSGQLPWRKVFIYLYSNSITLKIISWWKGWYKSSDFVVNLNDFI